MLLFKPIELTPTYTRVKNDLISVTIRTKGATRSQNSADINLSSIIQQGIETPLYFQVGYIGDTLAIQISTRLAENCCKIGTSRHKQKTASYFVSSRPACIAIFKHFNEPAPENENEVKTLIVKASSVPNVEGLFTLSFVKKISPASGRVRIGSQS